MKTVVVCAPRTGSTSFTEFLANAYAQNGIAADVRHDSDRHLALAVRDVVVDGSEDKLAACLRG